MFIGNLKFKGLSKRIMISFSILIFAILVFQLIATYYIIHVTVQNVNSNYLTVGLKQKNEKLDSFLKNVDLFTKTLISDRDLQTLLVEDSNTSFDLRNISHEMSYALSNLVEAVILISSNGNVYKEAETELGEFINSNIADIKDRVAGTHGEMLYIDTKLMNYVPDKKGDYFLIIARKIRNIETFEDIGIMVVAVKESLLWNNLFMDGEPGDYYIVSQSGDVVSCGNKELIGESIYNGLGSGVKIKDLDSHAGTQITEDLIINSSPNDMIKWTLVNAVTINELNANYVNVQRMVVITGFVAIIIAIYISIIISRNITRPVRDLIFSMKKVIAGNLDVRTDAELHKDTSDELKELNDVFNQMTEELQYLIEEVYHEKLREKESELKALKAQINPHFLYNTLDTIYWMLIQKGDYEVAELVTKLGEILRYGIKKNAGFVPLKEEIQQVENYLFIQKARFEDSLEYTIEIDEAILKFEMLSFMIQPFVENAINHGIMHDKGYGKVTIKGYCEEEKVWLEISDDGSGMSEEQVKRLLTEKHDKSNGHIGIGVLNVHERIKNYYGEGFGITIHSVKGQGTKVTLVIPVVKPGGYSREA